MVSVHNQKLATIIIPIIPFKPIAKQAFFLVPSILITHPMTVIITAPFETPKNMAEGLLSGGGGGGGGGHSDHPENFQKRG